MADPQSAPSSNPAPQSKLQIHQHDARKTQLKLIAVAIIAVILIFGTLGAVGFFGTSAEQLAVMQVNFGFSCGSQAIFTVTNNGPVDVKVSQVQATQIGVQGELATTQLTGNIIPKGTSNILTTYFPGLVFIGGAIYSFSLVTSRGAAFSIGALAPTVTVTEQLSTNQVTFNGGGQVAFALSTSGTCDVSIATVTVRGGGINGTVTGTILSGSDVPAGGSSSLSVNFSWVTFNSGTRYFFTLTTSYGNRFPVQATA